MFPQSLGPGCFPVDGMNLAMKITSRRFLADLGGDYVKKALAVARVNTSIWPPVVDISFFKFGGGQKLDEPFASTINVAPDSGLVESLTLACDVANFTPKLCAECQSTTLTNLAS